MNIPLSDADIKAHIPNVILYDQLNYEDIQLPVVILYQTGDNFGHWVLLHETTTPEGVVVEYFDSYGKQPDSFDNKIPERFRKPHYLIKLLEDLSQIVPIHYNDYPLQSTAPNIATCGRWCILRNQFSDTSTDDFAQSIADSCEQLQISPDEFVTRCIP